MNDERRIESLNDVATNLKANVVRLQIKHGLMDHDVADALDRLAEEFRHQGDKWAGIDWDTITDDEYDALLGDDDV